MADAIINVEFAPGLGMPYTAGAESALAPSDALAFDAVSAIAGTPLTLVPGFALPVDEIADLLCAARQSGTEPPDLFAWYSVACPEEVAAAVATALAALPFVVQASIEPPMALAAWEVATDSASLFQRYLRTGPVGVSAYLAWQVPGGSGHGARVAGVEDAWSLDHPDLAGAVTPLTILPAMDQDAMDHGTAVIGIVGARGNRVSLTGIAPNSALAVAASFLGRQAAGAIARAAGHVGRGGIVVIGYGETLLSAPKNAAVPLEHNAMVKAAIGLATALGVLVVEPAGNAKINLDTDSRFPNLRASPRSGALIVAAGDRAVDADGNETGEWVAADFTTGGSRVNCFAAGVEVAAPTSGSIGGIDHAFGGTSSASAIIAGTAAALQGIAIASERGRPLDGAELHARLSDPQFGHVAAAVSPTNPQSIGVMPDLAKLAEGVGVPMIFPVSALRIGPGRVVIMRTQGHNVKQIEILELTDTSSDWIAYGTSGDGGPFTNGVGHAVGLHVRFDGAITRVDAVANTERCGICHRPFVLDLGLGVNDGWRPIVRPTDEWEGFKISAPTTVAAQGTFMLVAGLSTSDLAIVVSAERKAGSDDIVPTANLSGTTTGHEPQSVIIDPLIRFNSSPVLYDHAGSIVLAGVDLSGWIRFAQWTLALGWTPFELVAAKLDPLYPPAIAHDGPALYVIGYDPDTGSVREIVRSPSAGTIFQWSAQRSIAEPPLATWGSSLVPAGPIVMASDGAGTLMAMALTAAGLPMFTVRPVGFDWTPLFWVPCLTTLVLRGGLAVASPSPGVFIAAASDARGTLHTARWTLVGWSPFAPV